MGQEQERKQLMVPQVESQTYLVFKDDYYTEIRAHGVRDARAKMKLFCPDGRLALVLPEGE